MARYFQREVIRSGTIEPGYYTKLGRYKPEERLKADQSLVPFVVNRKRVYDYVPPGEGARGGHTQHMDSTISCRHQGKGREFPMTKNRLGIKTSMYFAK